MRDQQMVVLLCKVSDLDEYAECECQHVLTHTVTDLSDRSVSFGISEAD